MTVHLCRDFLTLASASAPATSMYLVACFLRHVMSFDVDSNVNFDLNSSTFTKGQYDLDANNLSFGSINQTPGSEYFVVLPTGSYTVSVADVNRIMALRSSDYPQHNSGLFRITSASVLNNSLAIDYRSSEFPPTESGSLAWRIFEREDYVTGSWNTGSNGYVALYNTRGAGASASRIMFNSPSGYNLRLCLESTPDRSGTIPGGFSIAPGAGSISNADFDDLAGHLHGPMWFNSTSSVYRGTAVGLSPRVNVFEWTTGQWRFSAAGDTLKSSVVCFTRNVTFPSGGNGWCAFGIPDDEDTPMSDEIIDRLFVVGYGNAMPNLTWHSGYFNDGHAQGMAWSRFGFPSPCIMSSYADVRNRDPHARNLVSASATPFTNKTELIDVELLAGTMTSSVSPGATNIVPYAARRVGRLPLVKMGRSNYASWALTPDKQWLHTLDGVYLQWAGPHMSDSLTGSNNAMLIATASFINGEGLQFFEPNPPMSDPAVDLPATSVDKDATRFRKTYSYFRQPVVEVRVIKGGSNRPKP